MVHGVGSVVLALPSARSLASEGGGWHDAASLTEYPVKIMPFRAPVFLSHPHVQTVLGSWRRVPRPAWRRERIELADGDFLDVDHVDAADASVHVLVLHGLGGSSDAPYVRGVVQALSAAGYGVSALNFRGCSGEPNRLARAYHSGETGDLLLVAERLRAAHPGRRLYAVGFSLGGNALLKAMGEGGDNVPFAGALSVCAPLDLAICSAYLDDGAWFAYRQYLLFALRRMVKLKRRVLEGVIDVNRARASQTFREYDDAVTAPIHGFAGVDDYYARSSARQYLAGVRRPTVILHAADDPFMPMAVVPRADELSPSVQLVVSGQGGHVGFVGRAADGGRGWWLDSWVVESVRRFEHSDAGVPSGL